MLCASCHDSTALGAAGQPGVSALTSAMHSLHGNVHMVDGRLLNSVQDRSSCYTCHPGARTRCLRGAMGKAIGAEGNSMMGCQDCHGSMSQVGDPARTGWLEEPNCQNCHTGDAAIRPHGAGLLSRCRFAARLHRVARSRDPVPLARVGPKALIELLAPVTRDQNR